MQMAVYRTIQISFWQDDFILDLTPEEKYFYMYLMTNSKTTQCGIYELPKKIVSLETGYNSDTIDKLLVRFEDYGKIKYCTETKEILLINWIKYNPINNINIKKCVLKELEKVKSEELLSLFEGVNKGLLRDLDTPTKKKEKEEEKEEEEEEEEEKEEEEEEMEKVPPAPLEKIKNIFNSTCKSYSSIRTVSAKRKEHLRARWKQHNYMLEVFEELFNKAESSDFLKGKNSNNWKADFDWLINDNNMAKVLEGKYENKGGGGSGSPGKRNDKDHDQYDNPDIGFTL